MGDSEGRREVARMAVERERGPDAVTLRRVDGPANPPPKGYCEVWEGLFESARRVEIMAEEVCEEAPGTIHVVGLIEGSPQVRGVFYVPTGRSLAGRTVYS
jgi:hypothetical protein